MPFIICGSKLQSRTKNLLVDKAKKNPKDGQNNFKKN